MCGFFPTTLHCCEHYLRGQQYHDIADVNNVYCVSDPAEVGSASAARHMVALLVVAVSVVFIF